MKDADSRFRTQQEEFWAGSFGDEYINRNTEEKFLASNIALFSRILSYTKDVNSLVEFGPNIGLNLQALLTLRPKAKASGIELNESACQQLKERLPSVEIINQSILECEFETSCDLALIKGVLIHINPDALPDVYTKLAKASSKYVVIAEYYNPSPVTINYRGHQDRLFKRDFAGEFLDAQQDFELVDYGFVWRRDPNFPQDDITWFLMKRKQ